MLVRLSWPSFIGVNIGRYALYEEVGGNVTRVANSVIQQGYADPQTVYQIEPGVAEATFLQHCPEARKVIEIMAGAGSGSVVTTPIPNALALASQEVNISPANTAQQLPSLVIPDGRAVVIKSEQGNGNNVFVSDSAANVAVATSRYRLRAGDFVTLKVANLDQVWVLSTQNNQKIEIIVEQ